MRVLIVLLFALVAAAQPKPGEGSITGRVLDSLTSTPIRKAIVTLTATDIRLTAESDREGKFEFSGLPAGTYRLSASHLGYLERPSRRPVVLGGTEPIATTEIRLPPQGVILGRVLDEDGDTVDRARVWLYKQVYRHGRKHWERVNHIANTNASGEYRFQELSPGRYLVQAENLRPAIDNRYGESKQPKRYYVPAYYPNATAQHAAAPIDVGLGAEVRGIDVQLSRISQSPAVRVRGKVSGAPPGVSVSVGLLSTESPSHSSNTLVGPPDYAFELSVPVGQYRMAANVYEGRPEAYGVGSVTVAGETDGVIVALSPPPRLTARIRVAEADAKVDLKGVTVTLIEYIGIGSSVTRSQSDAAGRVTFERPLRPGRYAIEVDVRSLPAGSYLHKLMSGDQEVPAEFELNASAQIDIVLSNTAAQITGIVLDQDNKAVPDSTVTLLSADGKARRESADNDGTFRFSALAPGKYKLFGWELADDTLWQDPEYCKRYESRAADVTVGDRETATTKLQVIAIEEMR